MSWLNDLFANRPTRKTRNAELTQEIEEHLAERIDELVESGMSRADAATQARREFGNVALVELDSRDVWQWRWLENLFADARYAARSLRKSPGFAAIVVLTLALGIGANTAIFSVVNGVLLRSLPFPHPSQLVDIFSKSTLFDFASLGVSVADSEDVRTESTAFTSMSAYQYESKEFGGAGKPERIQAADVDANFFTVLGMQPQLGRAFTKEDMQAGSRTAILSYTFWRDRFGSDPAAVGRTVMLDGESSLIVGVMPESLHDAFPDFKVWLPFIPSKEDVATRGNHNFSVIARLKPGVTVAQAQLQLDATSAHLAAAYPDSDKGWSLHATGMQTDLFGDWRTPLIVLFCAAGFVLLIACANVSNLLLSRGWSRRREFAIRTAIGATRGALLRQLFVECLIVALISGVCAFLLALWTSDAIRAILPPDIPRLDAIRMDARVAFFTIDASLVAALVSGLAPALLGSRSDVTAAIKESGNGAQIHARGSSHHALRRLLVVGEVALAVTLLVGAVLAIRNFARLMKTDFAFRPDRVVTLRIDFPKFRFATTDPAIVFVQQILDRVRPLEGVQAASAGVIFPLADEVAEYTFQIGDLAQKQSNAQETARFNTITPDYFRTIAVPLLAGREFNNGDTKATPSAFIINEALARKAFGTTDVVGKRFAMGRPSSESDWGQIVGVVANEPTPHLGGVSNLEIYTAFAQARAASGVYLAVRTKNDPLALVPVIEDRIWELDKNQPISSVKTAGQMISETNASPRSQSMLLGIFAALGVILALVGVYGVMSYLVTQQRREIAIRVALGAESGNIFKIIVSHGLKLTLAGVAAGLAISLALTRFVHAMFYGIRVYDPVTFAAVSVSLTLVAVAACIIPARRAMRVDPMTALRCE
jgi:putative ABC transport system permease protein